jgi:hypothetical protein
LENPRLKSWVVSVAVETDRNRSIVCGETVEA